MTLLIPPRDENGVAGVIESHTGRNQSANGSREAPHERCQIAHPFLKRGAACIDGAADDLVVEHEVTHDPFCIDLDRRLSSRDAGEDIRHR